MTNIQSADVSASVRSDFNFDVEKYPLSAVMGTEVLPTDQYGLFRSDTGYLNGVKSVSPRYVPHTTDDVCALVDAAGEAFDGEIACDTHFRNGHYVSIAPTAEQRRSIFKDRDTDNVWPRVMINAGYDGKAFTATMGYFRDACSNLAMMRMKEGGMVYGGYSGMVPGEGHGMEDNVYMPIVDRKEGDQVATLAVSPDEYIVDAATVAALGNGSSDAGAKVLDETIKDIRQEAFGTTKQPNQINGLASLQQALKSNTG